jgi:branched-chain amino acid transport system substrate-binding protein
MQGKSDHIAVLRYPPIFLTCPRRTPVKLKRTLLLTLLSGAAALNLAWAQSEPGVTDKTIKLGVFAPLSGNAMAYGFDVLNAAKMYYDKINKEGGIHGRKIELVVEDDRCSANDVLAAVKKLTEQDKVFALNGGSCSGAVVGAREYIDRAQIPYVMLNASGDGALYPPSKYISTVPSPSRSARWAARWCSLHRRTSRARRSATSTMTTHTAVGTRKPPSSRPSKSVWTCKFSRSTPT